MLTSHTRRSTLIALAALVGACRYQATPVVLQGREADIAALAGTWIGEYSSEQSGRSGSVTMTVQAGKDTAHGDVLMEHTLGQPLRAADYGLPSHAGHVTDIDLLRVTLVRVTGGLVEGALEPYVAPDCNCVVSTIFRGVVDGNTITGDYVTRGEQGLRQVGTWQVRKGPAQ